MDGAPGSLLWDDVELAVAGGERVAADPDVVQARFDDLMAGVIPERQFFKAQRETDLFGFAGGQRDAREALQAVHRLFEAGADVADVTLHDLGGGDLAGVGDGGFGDDQTLRAGDRFADGQTLPRERSRRIARTAGRSSPAGNGPPSGWCINPPGMGTVNAQAGSAA